MANIHFSGSHTIPENLNNRGNYYPLGLQIPDRVFASGSLTREGFTGHELDPETGDYYAGARYYLPELGRWTAMDPLSDEYPGYSPYNYVLGDPVSLADPSGLCPDGLGVGDSFEDSDGNTRYCAAGQDDVTVTAQRPHPAEDGWYYGDGTLFVNLDRAGGRERYRQYLLDNPNEIGRTLQGNDEQSYNAQLIAAGVNRELAGEAFWNNPVTQGAIAVTTSFIGGGWLAAGSVSRTGMKAASTIGVQVARRAPLNVSNRVLGQTDAFHRATTFVRGDALSATRVAVQDSRSLWFQTPGAVNGVRGYHTVGVNPWTRRIFHEGFLPGRSGFNYPIPR